MSRLKKRRVREWNSRTLAQLDVLAGVLALFDLQSQPRLCRILVFRRRSDIASGGFGVFFGFRVVRRQFSTACRSRLRRRRVVKGDLDRSDRRLGDRIRAVGLDRAWVAGLAVLTDEYDHAGSNRLAVVADAA